MTIEERNQLIEDNIKLVGYFTKQYVPKVAGWLSRDEVYSAVNIGIVEAASAYEPERARTFASFVGLCAWRRCMNDMRTLKRIPPSISLQTPIGRDGEMVTLADMLPDRRTNIEESVADADLAQRMLNRLTSVDKRIVLLHAQGLQQPAIAKRLGYGQPAISRHLKTVREKMQNERREQ